MWNDGAFERGFVAVVGSQRNIGLLRKLIEGISISSIVLAKKFLMHDKRVHKSLQPGHWREEARLRHTHR
jgi:hypothetical protein